MRGFIKHRIVIEGDVTSIHQSGERLLLEVRPLGIPMYLDLSPGRLKGLEIGIGDFLMASFPWFYARAVKGGD
ncbi:hypothetical protein APY94_11110 [Thermococcus celericrescens]|uniref:Uncharacterized protein n=2 Tax=Thermococcus celericrescens TaxID=227598 RepID=A0A100XWD2_9EURY|nr:hypothetical protein APY94_11110 [Thermococcus celericrescens]